ncbi:hypothetical protein [Deinococcus yavapaiensis]|uniref:Uncharacterized protein n=1 Tax=Deinococcus yavapaiensis KR-236 TaxID=694435 RepID=A0A318S9Q9_9DEIO|nr:hypothetical protein [Deinococcus yavapaiensis]PYE55465.1 hypothetical protein DES52_103298 [Deinococcus yavapaiensis KR-236]
MPFLVRLHCYAPRASREKIPSLQDMDTKRAANVAMGLLGVGALVTPLHPLT